MSLSGLKSRLGNLLAGGLTVPPGTLIPQPGETPLAARPSPRGPSVLAAGADHRDGFAPSGRQDSGNITPSPPSAEDDLEVLVSTFSAYSRHLQAASAAAVAVQTASDQFAAALLQLSEAVEPLTLLSSGAGIVPFQAAAASVSTSLLPAFSAALTSSVCGPLAAILDSHRELSARLEQRAAAAREHAEASRDFGALLAKRGAAVAPASGSTTLAKISSTLGLSVPSAGMLESTRSASKLSSCMPPSLPQVTLPAPPQRPSLQSRLGRAQTGKRARWVASPPPLPP